MSISRDRVLAYVRQGAGRPLKIRELARALRVPEVDYRGFRRLVRQLEREGALVRLRNGRYGPPDRLNLTVGRLSVNPEGFGFVTRDAATDPDIFIGTTGLGAALHGDRVVVRVSRRGRGRTEGEVVRVLERAVKSVVGTYRTDGRFSFVKPDDPRLTRDVTIPPEGAGGAKEGQKVVVRIEAWPVGHTHPEGRIVEILGDPDDPGIDTLAIVKAFNLPVEFPPHVRSAADEISGTIPEAELQTRLDLRDLPCITIDPEDARDYDDAVSLEVLDGGTCRLGVHIADVSYYVREGTPLDAEALTRGTSVYLPDRVIPMLPERLSNEICTLRPDGDRLTISVLIRLDADGCPLDSEVVETVVRSRARFSYVEVQKVLDGDWRELSPPARRHADMLLQMEALRQRLTEHRLNRGAIDFEIPEPRIILDEDGKPVDIQKEVRLNSHRLIEEFMLLANQAVAEQMERRGVPILYRVHARPDGAQLAEFARIAAAFGYRLPDLNRIGPADIQELLFNFREKRVGTILTGVLLRAMKKAVYTPHNIGHFGLACTSYTHFTSPIRRYPDLLTHRLVREAISGKITEERKAALRERLPTLGDLATGREISAQGAERDAVKVKQIRFLEDRIGERFKATVVNVRPIGFFARLDDYLIDGLVRVGSLEDDYYTCQEIALVGERTGRTFRVGDPVVVELVGASRELRRLDFLLAEGGTTAPKPEAGRKRRLLPRSRRTRVKRYMKNRQ